MYGVKSSIVALAVIACTGFTPKVFGPYEATYVKNYDGDTITLKFEVYPKLWIEDNVRVLAIDTPEIRGKCQKEKDLAKLAKHYAASLLKNAKQILITTHGDDKYGRPLATVFVDQRPYNDIMVSAGYAAWYSSDLKRPKNWCE